MVWLGKRSNWEAQGFKLGRAGKNILRCRSFWLSMFLSSEDNEARSRGIWNGRKQWRLEQIRAGQTLPEASDLAAARRLGYETGILAVRTNDVKLEADNPWDDLAAGCAQRCGAALAWSEGFGAGWKAEGWRATARRRRDDMIILAAGIFLAGNAIALHNWVALMLVPLSWYGYFSGREALAPESKG